VITLKVLQLDKPNEPVRFNGVTLVAEFNFPEKEEAPAIAERMARFGLNLF